MKCLLWLTISLLISGCTTPVISPCISREQLAELERQEPEKVGPRLTGQADTDVKITAGSAMRLRAWGYNLRDALRICAK